MSMDFTNMTFCGRLVADPEEKTTRNDSIICKFTVATSRRAGKGKEVTSFLPVMVVGKEAEHCLKYLSKGREVLVNATFETDSYVDGKGIKRKGFTFVVGHNGFVTFGSGGAKKSDDSGSNSADAAVTKMSKKLSRDSGF